MTSIDLPRRRAGLAPALLVAILALVAGPAAASASPARPGTYTGVEYHDGHTTDFLSMTLAVISSGRAFRGLQGSVQATCTSAGGPNYFQNFDFDFPTATRISGQGEFKREYSTTETVSGAEAVQTLELTGTFDGNRITHGTFAFHAYVTGQGPGCEYDAEWRGRRR